MIPKIIHQTTSDPAKLDLRIADNIEFLKSNNPGWEHRLYSDEDLRKYLKANLSAAGFQTVQKLNHKYSVVLADLFRYVVLYVEGGVYLDIKSTARKPLDSVISDDDAYILSQWSNKAGEQYQGAGLHPELVRVPGGEFQQWHIVSTPRHPFLKYVIQNTIFNCANYHPNWFGVGKMGVLRLSGPICYTLTIAPLRFRHKHRIATAEQLGFEYSIYPKQGNAEYHSMRPDHYSRQIEPIFPYSKIDPG
jgi:mannosyltransferase OCH1-like enzyme